MSTSTSSWSIRTTWPVTTCALLDRLEGGVVVGDDLAVDFQQESVRPLDDAGVGLLSQRLHRRSLAQAGHARPPDGRSYDWTMPVRATKRGAERTPLERRDCDVLICGASFAGLAVARELAGSGAKVLVIDRYELGERQTSACAMPTLWLDALELGGSELQSFDELVTHTPFRSSRWALPWSFSTFDYRELCALLWAQSGADGAEADGRDRIRARDRHGHRPRGLHRAHRPRRAAGAADRRRARLAARALERAGGVPIQPPNAPMSRGLEVHPAGHRRGDGAVDRPPLHPLRLRLELPRARRAARRRRLVLARRTTSRSRPSGSPATWASRPTATRATGSPTSCARPSRTRCSSPATRPGTACR